MDIKASKKVIRILGMVLVLLFPALLLMKLVLLKPQHDLVATQPRFVGGQVCAECHMN